MSRERPGSSHAASTTVAILAASLLLALAPTSLGYHLSAGAEDTVGLAQEEPPADTDPALYERGTSTDCEQPEPSNATFPLEDAFCGELVYNQGTPFQTPSPVDQVTRRGITIDLQMASYVGAYGTTTCSPWCNAPQAYDALNDAGAEGGLTPTSDEVDDGGEQAYGGHAFTLAPMHAYAAAGQGWLIPVTDTSFVAFVSEDEGGSVDEQRLDELVSQAIDDEDLDPRAQPEVCAFSPQAHVGGHAPDSGRCEVVLDWMGDDGEGACQAETYVCGAMQPAWRSTTMCPMWHAACYLSDAWNSAHHFAVWHGVVAPSPPKDCSAAEPGFDTADHTFLAHDLDVYTPPSDATPARGVPFAWDEAADNVPGIGPLREGRAPDVADTPAGESIQATPAFTQPAPEPNTDGWLGIDESSHERTADRSIDTCTTLATGEEEADPWVNIVDAHVTRDVSGFGAPLGDEPHPDHEPKPSMRVTGMVGAFADVDDDGDHEQAPHSEVFQIDEHGAYPILWDHHDKGEGCEFRAGDTIGDLSTEAGYADPTGLVVTLRLSDGALVDTRTGEVMPVVGPSAIVMLSGNLDPEQEDVADVIEQAAGDRPVIELADAFQPQCGEPTGGFTAAWEILAEPMEGDGLAAAAIATVEDGAPGSETGAVPASPIELSGTTVWWDVDPFEPAE